MVDNNTVTGIKLRKDDHEGRCVECVFGKMHAKPSPARNSRESVPGAIIHSDLEFMIDETFQQATYCLKFVDEATGYVWVHPIKDKEAATILRHFQLLDAFIENQFKTRISKLHSDNGGEFVNDKMKTYLETRGIVHETSAPHRHEMNGIVEHSHRVGSDAVRSMLKDAQLSRKFWGEAYSYWAYARNRTSVSFLNADSTPFEALHGFKPDISHLRIFGSPAYIRIPPSQRKKLDDKAIEGIFVGVYDDAAYRIIVPGSHDILKSCDVTFDEQCTFRTRKQHDPESPSILDLEVNTQIEPTSSIEPEQSSIAPAQPRRSNRVSVPTQRLLDSQEQEHGLQHLDEEANFTHEPRYIDGILEPTSWKQAMGTPQAEEWKKAGAYELGKLLQHEVWEEVDLPPGAHLLRGRWVAAVKCQPDGSHDLRFRWVVRGDKQLEDEYNDLFSSMGDYTMAKWVYALAANKGMDMRVIDISSAFLHSPIEETIYVEYPHGFQPLAGPMKVCRLLKALYGTRQGPIQWEKTFSATLESHGFKCLVSAPSTYYRDTIEGETIAATHVDDIVSDHVTKGIKSEGDKFEQDIAAHFQYKKKDLSKLTNMLGWTIERRDGFVKISVPKKIDLMLTKYKMKDANPCSTPMTVDALNAFEQDKIRLKDKEDATSVTFPYSSLVGELMWIASNVRPDILFATQILSSYLIKPNEIHITAVKRILRYLLETKELGLVFQDHSEKIPRPTGYSDSDFASDPKDRKSFTGYAFLVNGAAVSWKCRKQTVVALSTQEAEYLALSHAAREAIWFRHIYQETNRPFDDMPIHLYCDNLGATKMSKDPIFRSKTKHIDIAAHRHPYKTTS